MLTKTILFFGALLGCSVVTASTTNAAAAAHEQSLDEIPSFDDFDVTVETMEDELIDEMEHRELTGPRFVGAVYAMSNDFNRNAIFAYGRLSDGSHRFIGSFNTRGTGAAFDGGEGLNPLISSNSVLITDNNRFLVTVNAGSNSITSFRINSDFSLTFIDVDPVGCTGPNSLGYFDGILYVACVDDDGRFSGTTDQVGSLLGFYLDSRTGRLRSISRSRRVLTNRPSDLKFTTDGKFLVVSGFNAGAGDLPNDQIVVFKVRSSSGRLSSRPVSRAASTSVGNRQGRNLATTIGFVIIKSGGKQFIVASESREFGPDGSPPTTATLQTGSVSVWRLSRSGRLIAVELDVLAGRSPTNGQRTTCWIEPTIDEDTLFLANTIDSSISTFRFRGRRGVDLVEEVEVSGDTGDFIDLATSCDGTFLYQLKGLNGAIGVYSVSRRGLGNDLSNLQLLDGNLPETNTQGIAAI